MCLMFKIRATVYEILSIFVSTPWNENENIKGVSKC